MKKVLQRKLMLIAVLLLSVTISNNLFAQNAIVGTGFSSGWGGGSCPTGNGNFTYLGPSAGTTYIVSLNPNGTGDQYFRFGVDWGGTTAQLTNTIGSNVLVSPNTTYNLNTNCTTNGALYINCPNTTDNYVFKTLNAGTNPTGTWVFFRVQGAVQSVSSVTRNPSGTIFPGQAVTVTANLSAAFATGQQAYIRYTTNGYATSTVVAGSGAGATRTFTIPATVNTPGANLSYYIFTSGDSGPAADGSNADLYTINLNNNGGSNYSYTVASGWTTAATGNWNVAGTWTANAVPSATLSMGTITINHAVTQNVNAVGTSVVVGASGSITGSANTLTVDNNTSGTNFTNSGTLTLSGTHAVTFAGTATHTVSGTCVFHNVNTTTGINFGAGSTINNNFTINAGGFVSSNAPTYGSASTLIYNTGGSYGAGAEWATNILTGQGVPNNVTISTASTSVNFGASTQYRRLRGNLLISPSTTLALSSASGGDLRIGGSWTNSGTFTPNSRAVIFDGSTGQTINATATNFAFLFISNTTADVTAAAAITVANSLTIDANARLNMALNTLTITGSTSTVNGFLRSAGTITGATTSSLTFSSTGTYEHNFTTTAGTIPTATWSAGSTCAIIGYTSFSGSANASMNQTFSNFTWDCPNQTANTNIQLNNITPPVINGTFSILRTGASQFLRLASSGSYTLNVGNLVISSQVSYSARLNTSNTATAVINVSGNITLTQTAGTAGLEHTSTGSTTINLVGSISQTFTCATPGIVVGPVNFRLNNAAGAVLAAGTTLPINNGATLFRTNGAFSGTGTITFNATASTLNYDGSTTLTSTNYEWPATGAAITQIIISGGGTINLHTNRTLNNTANYLSITSGILALGNNNLTLPAANTLSVISPSASKMIATNGTGLLIHTITTSVPTTYTFPIGELTVTTEYSPVALTMTANSATRLVGFRVVDATSGNINTPINATDYLSRTWFSSENLAGGTYTYNVALTYNNVSGDINGTEGLFKVSSYASGAWTPAPATSLSSPTITGSNFNNTSADLNGGEFTGRKQLATTYTWDGSTNTDWNEADNWTPAGVPAADDNVIINISTPNICTIGSGSVTVTDFTLNGTGQLNMSATTSLTIAGAVTYGGSATASLNCSSTINMYSTGSINIPALNYGSLDASGGVRVLPNGGTVGICGSYTPGTSTTVTGSTVDFNGTGTQSIAAATYNNLTISNNRGGANITLSAGTATVNGVFNPSLTNFTATVTGNTIDFNNAASQNIPAFIYGSITNTGNGNRTWANTGVIEVRGNFTPGTGLHTITGSTFRYAASSGTITLPAPFTTNVANRQYNNLEFNGSGATFQINNSVNHGITGNLTVDNGIVIIASSAATTLSVDGNFTINGGEYRAAGSTTGITHLYNNFSQTGGTITRTGGTGTIAFRKQGTLLAFAVQNISQTGGTVASTVIFSAGVTGPTYSMPTLTTGFNVNTGSFVVVSGSAIDFGLNILTGTTFTLSNGGNILTANVDGINTAPTATGSIQTTNRTIGASCNFIYNGTSAQNTGTLISGTPTFLTIANPTSVTLDKDISINSGGGINMLAGRFILGNFNVTIAATAAIGGNPFSASNMLVTNGTGELRKSVTTSPTTFTWPVGDTTATADYSPITLTVTFGASGYVGFRVIDAIEPNNGSATNYITRYWVASTNLSTYSWSGSATYTAPDKAGLESAYKLNIYDPNAPSIGWSQYANSSAAANTLTITSGPGTGTLNNTSITAREDITLYYQSNGNGAWDVASNWQVANNPSFTGATTATVAPNNANSYGIWIRSGHTITVGTTVWADDLTIDNGGTLTIGGGGNFTLANGTAATDFTNDGTFNINNTTTIQSGSVNVNNNLITATVSPSSFGAITHNGSAVYNHAVDGGTIPASTWNSGSLLRITALNTTSSVGGFNQTFHHIEFNSPSQTTASLQILGAITGINGNLTMAASGTREVRIFGHSGNTNTSLTIGGNLIVTGGRLAVCNATSNGTQAVTLNVTGDVSVSSTGILDLTGSSANTSGTITLNTSGNVSVTGTGTIVKTQTVNTAIFRYNKTTGTQTYTAVAPATAVSANPISWQVGNGTTQPELILASDFVENATATFTVSSLATLNCGTYTVQGTTAGTTGSFTLQSTGTLKMGSPDGITAAPNAVGNIQTGPAAGNRVFNTGSYYEYNGSANQVTGLGLPTTIARLTINNSGAPLSNIVTLLQGTAIGTNGQLNLTSGIFKIGNSGNIVTLSGNNTVNGTGGDFASGNEGGIVRAITSNSSATGTLNFWELRTSTGFNFGSASTVNGRFRIDAGGFVLTNPPTYAVGSTLQYNSGGTYGRSLEWSATSGQGYPHHVQVTTTILNLGNSGTSTARVCGGDLIIDANSTLSMNVGGSEMTASLTVNGDVTFVSPTTSSTLTLSSQIGGDLFVKGDWIRNGGTFNSNNRLVSFNGTALQTINGPANTTFDYLRIDNATGVQLSGADITVAQQLDMQSGHFTLNNNNVSLNSFANIINASNSKYVVTNGTGLLIQSLGGVNTLYPVGPNTTQYSPATLAQFATVDNIGVRVKTAPAFDDAVNNDLEMVNYQWYISEGTAGGNSLFTQFQWNGSDEATNFIRTNPVFHGDWNGAVYNIRATNATGGSNPYTSGSSTNYAGNLNRAFVVGNLNGIKGCISSVQNGDWNTSTTWEAGVVPPKDANVCLNHNVTVNVVDPDTVGSITFSATSNLTLATGRIVTMSNGGFFSNAKPGLDLGSGKVVFSGTGAINGTQATTFNDVEINNGLTINIIPTIKGTFRINAGGFLISNSLNYNVSSTLEYNTGGTYGRNLEWSATSGAGYPHHVSITGNTLLNLGNGGSATARQNAGDLNISNGSGLTMAGPPNMTATLTVKGNLNLNGSLALSNSAGGDFVLEGDWIRNGTTGVFISNNRAVFFNGLTDQFVRITGGGMENFPYMLINKPNAGTYVKMYNSGSDLTDLRITGTSGGVLQLLNNGGLDLNGRTVGIDRNSNTGAPTVWIEVNGAREIINSGGISNGEFRFYSTTNPNQPTWFTAAVKNVAGVGTLTFRNNVLMTIADGSCDFGINAGNPITTIEGILQVKLGGSVGQTMNPCFYAVGSTLRFANTVDYLVPSNDKTWAAGAINSGLAGIPYNVEVIDNNTDLTLNDARALKNNLTITNGKFIINPGAGNEFSLGGNWTRTGATSAFTNNAGARVVFRGSAPQSLLCTASSNTETFKELEIDNSGGLGNNAITLGGSTRVLVTDSIVFTQGIITTGSNRVETNPTTGFVASAGNTNYTQSWINGNLRRNVTNSNTIVEFPVGIATRGNLAVVYSNALTGISFYDASFNPVSGGNDSEMDAWETSIPGNPYHTKYLMMNAGGFWTVEPDVQPASGTYDMRLYFNGMLGGMADNQFGILKRANGSTTYADFKPFPGTSINTSGGLGRMLADGFALRMGYTSFSQFGIGLSGVPLPVQLTSFTGYKDGAVNQLNWKSSSELNTLEFIVERSTDAINFIALGSVDAAGFSTMPLNYQFTDNAPENAINYYRLKMVDIDYTYEYSNIIAINNINIFISNDIVLFPNPTTDNLFANITSASKQDMNIVVLDMSGRIISTTQVVLAEGKNIVPLNSYMLAAGNYILEFRDKHNGIISSKKFTKKN